MEGDENISVPSAKTYTKSKEVVDLTIVSPFKNSSHVNMINKPKKVQLKLDKMQSYNLKNLGTTTTNSNILLNDKQDENRLAHKKNENEPKSKHENKESTQNWKVKAIIDNRNFLIPVS